MFCVIWSNKERIKMVLESANSRECASNIFSLKKIYRPPGGTWRRLIQGAWPILHSWNNSTLIERHWKEPLRRSPMKKVKVADCSEQQYDAQQDLFIWNWWQYSTWWFTCRFWKNNKGLTYKASKNDDLNDALEVELKLLTITNN